MRKDLSGCDNLQIFMLSCHVLMLDDDFANWCLLGEVKLSNTLLQQLGIDVIQVNDDLSAN